MKQTQQPTSLIVYAVMLSISLFTHDPVLAYTVNITAGTRVVYLVVGNGAFTGTLQGGGTPANNATVNSVSVTVAANQIGNSTAQGMQTNSTQAQSYYDSFVFCSPAAQQVYVGGFYRIPGTTAATATLSVSTPIGGLLNASGDTIPFSQISWVSSGIGDTGAQVFPTGAFTGGTQTLATLNRNTWNESCHAFSYANTNLVAAGTYTGRATYTLTAP